MAPAMLVIQTVRHQPIDVAVNAAGTVVLFVLLTARMTGLAGQAARQQERELALAKVLEAAQQERIRLAADLHDGPVQELTALSYGLERVDRRLQAQGPDAALPLLGEQKVHLTEVTRTPRNLLSELHPPPSTSTAWPAPSSCTGTPSGPSPVASLASTLLGLEVNATRG
jgi:signal transduction histidine kinase